MKKRHESGLSAGEWMAFCAVLLDRLGSPQIISQEDTDLVAGKEINLAKAQDRSIVLTMRDPQSN